MSDLTERLFKHANDTINDWQGTADDWEAYARRTDAICVEAARDIQRLTAALAEARGKALEEAAKVAETIGRSVGAGDGSTYVPGTSAQAAAAIRALKEKP